MCALSSVISQASEDAGIDYLKAIAFWMKMCFDVEDKRIRLKIQQRTCCVDWEQSLEILILIPLPYMV